MIKKVSLIAKIFIVVMTMCALPVFAASVDLKFYNCSAHNITQGLPDDRYNTTTVLHAPSSIEYYAKDAHWWKGPAWDRVGTIGCRHYGLHSSFYSSSLLNRTESLDVNCGHPHYLGSMDTEYMEYPSRGTWAYRAHINKGKKFKLRLSKDSPMVKIHVGSNPASEYAVFVYTETGIGGVGPGDRDMRGNELAEDYFVQHGLRYPRFESPHPSPPGHPDPSSPIRPILSNFLVKPLDEVTDLDFQMCGSRGWLGYLIF